METVNLLLFTDFGISDANPPLIPRGLLGVYFRSGQLLTRTVDGTEAGIGATVIPDGGTLQGAYMSAVYVDGDCVLGSDLVINGSLTVKGSVYNPDGHNFLVRGTCLVLGILNLTPNVGTPTGTAQVSGDLFTGFLSPPPSADGTVVSADDVTGNLVISFDASRLGFYGTPNVASGAFVLFTSGAQDGNQFQTNSIVGDVCYASGGQGILTGVLPGDTITLSQAGISISQYKSSAGSQQTLLVGGNYFSYGIEFSCVPQTGLNGNNMTVEGDLRGLFSDLNNLGSFPFIDCGADASGAGGNLGGTAGTMTIQGSSYDMSFVGVGGLGGPGGDGGTLNIHNDLRLTSNPAVIFLNAPDGNGGNITVGGTVVLNPGFQLDLSGSLANGNFAQPNSERYFPSTPGNWATQPTTIQQAIDRIAAVVSSNGGTPIP